MKLNHHFFIYLEALTFILLSTMFLLLYKSNKWFQRSRALSKKDDRFIYMKYLLLFTVFLGLSTPSGAVTTRMFKVLDTCARYRLKEKTALVAIKDLKLKYEGKDESEAELFIKLYCSVFTPNENVDF